ncbi:ABC transporter substrate-binding protein [Consotaella salsifontis]|uniref:ABC transporter substrate-binding protein n=1 Tax=Consotaella salsifontis TaxID=1365950 RepID=UPI0009997006
MKAVVALTLVALAFWAAPGRAESAADRLIVGEASESTSLDPQSAMLDSDFRVLVNLYDGLVRFKPDSLDIEPALASRWDISPDGLTYTFHLRQGVRFHDGALLDAQAVKFTFERMLRPDHPFHDTGPFPFAYLFSAVARIDAPDPQTVIFHLKEPFAPFLSHLAHPAGLIVSPEAVKKGGKTFARSPVGTGPFRFGEWRPGEALTLSRNNDYWDGAPLLVAVEFRTVGDAAARAAALRSGNIDLAFDFDPDARRAFAKDRAFQVFEAVKPHLWFLFLNTQEGPFADKRVRKAANLAIDKKTLVEDVLGGSAVEAAGPISPSFTWALDGKTAPYPYDPDKARRLIREAGAEGRTVVLLAAEDGAGMLSPLAMAKAIAADLQKVGLNVAIESASWTRFLSRVNPGLLGRADMAEMAWMTADPDTLPYLALRSSNTPDRGGFNVGLYANKDLDQMIEAAHVSTDRAERATLYSKIQRIAHDDAPWVFVAHGKANAVARSTVKDFALPPTALPRLDKVRKE